MKFLDETMIRVAAGHGGAGAVSFARRRNLREGPPDGGDGGDGGSVYLLGQAALNTLVDLRPRSSHRAGAGGRGFRQRQSGVRGEDRLLPVPLGTRVSDADTGELIGEVLQDHQRLMVARGGRRGAGNAHFKSSRNRSPQKAQGGLEGERRNLKLELRLLADVGLVGLPNAGKSTLLAGLSRARPKIGAYPFSTLHPQLGVVRTGVADEFVLADVPGLLPGAAKGVGLGAQFLRHLSRARLLLELIDCAGEYPVAEAHRLISAELEAAGLTEHPRWLVLSKTDRVDEPEKPLDDLRRVAKDRPVYPISSVTGAGLTELAESLAAHFGQANG